MPLDPWHYASKTSNEHAEQVALFMWANMARNFGPIIAADPNSYNIAGFAKTQFDNAGQLGYKVYAPPIPQLKWLHAIPNQGHGDAVRGGRSKAEGVKAGVADVFLPVPQHQMFEDGLVAGVEIVKCGFYIELKRRDSHGKPKGRPSDVQLEFQTDMLAAGYHHEVIYGWELARDAILRYLDRMPMPDWQS